MTVTGLGTVNFAEFHVYTQVLTWFLILLGGQVMMASVPLIVRKYTFLWNFRRCGMCVCVYVHVYVCVCVCASVCVCACVCV